MEKKSVLASLLLTLMLSPLPLAVAMTESTARQLCPLDDVDIWINALSYYSYYYTDCKTGGRIYGSFDVTYGTDIGFFICDRAAYNSWTGGSSVSVYEKHPDVGSLSYSFSLPYDGIWHIVFYNDDLFFSRCIEGTVYYTSPAAQDGSLMLLLVIGGLAVLAVIAIAGSRHAKHKTQPVIPSGQGYSPQQYARSSQPVTQIVYCPSCGAARRSPQDKFCATCGRPLGAGPELR